MRRRFLINSFARQPMNQIWYTSTDGNVVTPYATDVFGANIVSNTYQNGKGVITFDGDVTSIGDDAFFWCSRLISVTIPDSVTTIGSHVFDACTKLTDVTIPDSVTTIGGYVFRECYSLTSMTIPNSVTEIGNFAFESCRSLTSVYCKATTPPVLGLDIFYSFSDGCKIYVPYQSLDAYKTAANWLEYADDIVGYDYENNKVYYPDSTTFEFPLYINVTDVVYEDDSSIEYSKSNSITDELWQWCQNKYAEGIYIIENPNIYINGNRITSIAHDIHDWFFYWENMEDNWYGGITDCDIYIGMYK